MDALKYVQKVVEALIGNGAKSAVKYVDEKTTVKATRKQYQGKVSKKNEPLDIVLTIGRPNFAEREFIKLCKQAKEPFPVKMIQLKYPPKKKGSR